MRNITASFMPLLQKNCRIRLEYKQKKKKKFGWCFIKLKTQSDSLTQPVFNSVFVLQTVLFTSHLEFAEVINAAALLQSLSLRDKFNITESSDNEQRTNRRGHPKTITDDHYCSQGRKRRLFDLILFLSSLSKSRADRPHGSLGSFTLILLM